MASTDLSREQLLDAYGRFYGEQHFAVAFTSSVSGDNAKRVTTEGWDKTQPLASGDFGAALVAGRGKKRNPVIVLRASGLLALESDSEPDLARIAQLELPKTLTVRSSEPYKRHYYFRPDPTMEVLPYVAFRFESGKLTADSGRYFLAPPSIHPSGAVYSFLPDHGPDETEIATLPESVYRALSEQARHETSELRHAIEIDPEAKIRAGNRRDLIFRYACMLRRWGLSEFEITAQCHAFNETRCDPPVARDLVQVQVAGAMKKHGGQELERATVDAWDLDSEPDPDAIPLEIEEAAPPVFLDAYEFVNLQTDPPDPLWGDRDVTLIPAGGLCILAGRPGCGKTTLAVDLACHLAAGVPYPPHEPGNGPPPLAVPRPLVVALIENEGPEEMFRAKLAEKLAVFPHRIHEGVGRLLIQTWRWGAFSFADRDAHERARRELDEHGVDLVIGDPLLMLGPEGVGSPAETRDFVRILRPLGLGTTRAFLFLHHFRERVERTEDELARISGAWGGHLDTLLTLTATSHDDQARLAYPKLRWAKTRKPNPLILGRVWNTQTFETIGEEGDATILEPLVYEHLARSRAAKKGRSGEGWQTATEIAGEIERRRVDVRKALDGAPHLFTSLTGEAARAAGAKKSNAVLWGLAEWTRSDELAPEPPTQEAFDDGIPF